MSHSFNVLFIGPLLMYPLFAQNISSQYPKDSALFLL